jgi:hypothetical protein
MHNRLGRLDHRGDGNGARLICSKICSSRHRIGDKPLRDLCVYCWWGAANSFQEAVLLSVFCVNGTPKINEK